MSIQDIVHRIQAGRGRLLISAFTIAFVVIAAGGWFVLQNFVGLNSVEAIDAAQVARRLATGGGFTTQYVRPMSVAVVNLQRENEREKGKNAADVNLLGMPDVNNSPGYIAALAAIFRLSGTDFVYAPDPGARKFIYFPEKLMVGFSLLCLAFTALGVYLLGMRLFDRRVGLLAVTLYLLTNSVWAYSISGLSTNLILLLLTWYFLIVQEAMLRTENKSPMVWVLLPLAGLLLGLAIVCRYSLAGLIIPQGVMMLIFFRKQILPAFLAILICAGVMTPWLVRNYNLTGTVFGANTRVFASGSEVDGTFSEERVYQIKEHEPWARKTLIKIYDGGKFHLAYFFSLTGSSVVVLLAVTSLFHFFRRARAQALRWGIVLSLPFVAIGATMLRTQPADISEYNNFFVLVPGLIVFGAAFFYVLMDRIESDTRLFRFLMQVVLAILCAIPLFMDLVPRNRAPFAFPPYNPVLFQALANYFKPTEILCSDCAWGVAWYGNRTVVQLPDKPSSYVAMHDRQTINAILLGPLSWDRDYRSIDRGPFKEWAPLIKRQGMPPKMPPMGAVQPVPAPPNDDFLIVADYARWAGTAAPNVPTVPRPEDEKAAKPEAAASPAP